MLKQIEGSHAMAEAIALCRPEVICAYPITPQTHIVEGLADLIREGRLTNCEYINVESEFAALSVAIGASAAGARALPRPPRRAFCSWPKRSTTPPVSACHRHDARQPRIGAPINIWNDHSDAMAMRDAGWLQLLTEDIRKPSIFTSRRSGLPKNCRCQSWSASMDFILTHAMERD